MAADKTVMLAIDYFQWSFDNRPEFDKARRRGGGRRRACEIAVWVARS
jgi:hypothetical protein